MREMSRPQPSPEELSPASGIREVSQAPATERLSNSPDDPPTERELHIAAQMRERREYEDRRREHFSQLIADNGLSGVVDSYAEGAGTVDDQLLFRETYGHLLSEED